MSRHGLPIIGGAGDIGTGVFLKTKGDENGRRRISYQSSGQFTLALSAYMVMLHGGDAHRVAYDTDASSSSGWLNNRHRAGDFSRNIYILFSAITWRRNGSPDRMGGGI